jgi:hypothetical protein
MPQRTLRTELLKQVLGLHEGVAADTGTAKQNSPTTCDFLFGKQTDTSWLELSVVAGIRRVAGWQLRRNLVNTAD